MDAYKDYCVLAVRNNNDESKPYTLIICNNINTTVDSKIFIFIKFNVQDINLFNIALFIL